MKFPYCLTDRLGFSSTFTYEDCGYEGEGTVEFYECDNCGAMVEVCIPENNPYGDVNKMRKTMDNQEQKDISEQIHETVYGLRDTVTKIIGKYLSVCSQLKDCRNELCLKCGRYKEAHNGACDDCLYRHGGEWEEDLNG